MSLTLILIAVQLIAVVGSKASAQNYDCVADSSDEAVGLREDVVSWVTGSDPRVVVKRSALQLLPATASQVTVVTQKSTCQEAASAYHAYLLPAGTPAISRNMVVIKIANNRYVIKDPAERQGEFGSVLITDGSFTVLARITG
jgi:hypothetical protein